MEPDSSGDRTHNRREEERYTSGLLNLLAGAVCGIGIEQLFEGEYKSGGSILLIAVCIFTVSFFWERIALRAPMRIRKTAAIAALDFRWWLGIVLFFVAYLAIAPFVNRPTISLPSGILTEGSASFEGYPLAVDWSSSGFLWDMSAPPESRKILEFNVTAKNSGKDMISLHNAYMISDITGQKLTGTVNTNPFPEIRVPDTAPVPPRAWLLFHFKFANGITNEQLTNDWSSFTIHIEYERTDLHHFFSAQSVARMAAAVYPQSAPHVTRRP